MASSQETCYICLGERIEEDPFMDPNPCACKGTIKLHKSCYSTLRGTSESCGICKTKYRTTFTGIKRSPLSKFVYNDGTVVDDGLFIMFNTILILEASYVDGILEGPYKIFDYNKLLEEGTYVANKKDGITKKYRPDDGRLLEEITYRANKKHGPQIKYHPSGTQVEEIFWNEDFREGPSSLYVYGTDWNLQEESLYDKNKLMVTRLFYINGPMKSEKHYVNDRLHGPYRIYSKEGLLKEEGHFEDNVLNGNYKLYSEKGIVKEEKVYVNGILNGPYKVYDQLGRLREEYTYFSGLRIKGYKVYDETGKMKLKNR
jgi:antitoxin component YwqK of YwqJK toxin-antitoxin module